MRPVRTAAGEDAGCGHRDGFHREFMGIFSWENGGLLPTRGVHGILGSTRGIFPWDFSWDLNGE